MTTYSEIEGNSIVKSNVHVSEIRSSVGGSFASNRTDFTTWGYYPEIYATPGEYQQRGVEGVFDGISVTFDAVDMDLPDAQALAAQDLENYRAEKEAGGMLWEHGGGTYLVLPDPGIMAGIHARANLPSAKSPRALKAFNVASGRASFLRGLSVPDAKSLSESVGDFVDALYEAEGDGYDAVYAAVDVAEVRAAVQSAKDAMDLI